VNHSDIGHRQEPGRDQGDGYATFCGAPGFLVFGLFAQNENLVALHLLPWEWQHEEIGFLVFLAALGTVTANRFLGSEARLRRLENELEIARRIQSSILPRSLLAGRGLKMAARYIPAALVAGDFYDVLAPDETQLCALVKGQAQTILHQK